MQRTFLHMKSISFLTACLLFVLIAINPPRAKAQLLLSVDPTSVVAGGTVTVAWAGIARPTSTDWVGLYLPGAANTSYLDWIYVSCSQTAGSPRASGSCSFVLPGSLAPGIYELRLLANDGTRLTISFSIVGGGSDVVRFLEQATFGPTQPLIAQVGQVGVEGYLDAQFNAPMTDYPGSRVLAANAPCELYGRLPTR